MRERPIRVLLAISDLRGGGAEREFASLVKWLSRDQFEVHVCLWRPTAVYTLPDDVQVHMVRKERPWHVFGAIRKLRHLVDTLQPDVVFSQLHYVNIVMGTSLARTRHRPGWVFRLVNDPRREMRGPFAVWARRALTRADFALGASAGVSRAMIDHLQLQPARVGTLDNVVDVATIEELAEMPLPIERVPGRLVIANVGRLTQQKNQALLLRAFQALHDPEVELWMLGEGELHDALRDLAEDLGVSGQVKWLGFVQNPYPFIRSADCLALTSDHEGLPNVIIEAMICGTPVVSTDCDFGPGELIENGVTGVLVPVGDQEALTRALKSIAADPEAAGEMGSRARLQACLRFQTSTVVAKYEAVLAQLTREAS